ncbi:MAG: DUF1028 domain-containing protein [Cyanobacteria bacterium SZAS LIN-3]|nr:DUF1028 domain-containing protein [Cyanobacteria bacterium SZAS LIN-3]
MTFSIVARDKATGQFGVAVASHWFNTGADVAWIGGFSGAIAVQAVIGLRLAASIGENLKGGLPAEQALAKILAEDELAKFRQVAVVDGQGKVAAHTGANCIPFASHQIGDGFCVQANMMLNDSVVPAMYRAYSEMIADPSSSHENHSFTHRLFNTLVAAQEAGGDIRGQQSAAIIIAPADGGPPNLVDLRIIDHKKPLEELARLIHLQEAYTLMNKGDGEIARGDEDAAIAAYSAAARSVPDNIECQYWHAVTLINAGRKAEAKTILEGVYGKNEIWRELTERLIRCGIISK